MSDVAQEETRYSPPTLMPLELLFERPNLPRFGLPAGLLQEYGGELGFSTPRVFANFVASVDGVVGLRDGGESGHVISQNSANDRFVMGLLRACADTVIIGAGTFRRTSGHLWNADAICPAAAPLFAKTRTLLGLAPRPTLVILTGSGEIDAREPAVADAVIVTTRAGEAVLRRRVPSTTRFIAADEIRLEEVLALLQKEGSRLVLTEGGPSLLAEFVAGRLLDELFVTSSPTLFGRFPSDGRKSLADGLDLSGVPLELLSVRRAESHLFLRYSLRRQ